MDNLHQPNRIKRKWRPEDDGDGGDQNQQQSNDQSQQQGQQDCDGQQGQQGGDQQGQQGQQGQGQPQQGQSGQGSGQSQQQGQQGQQGQQPQQGQSSSQPSGQQSGGATNSGGPNRGPVSEEQMRAAEALREEHAKQRQREMQQEADSRGVSLEQVQAERNPSKSIKYDWADALKAKRKHRNNSRRNEKHIEHYDPDTDTFTEEAIPMGDNPEDNVKKHLAKMREISKKSTNSNDNTSEGWSHHHSGLAGEDKKLADDDDKMRYSTLGQELNKGRTDSVFDPASGQSIRKLNNSFAVLAGKIAEDAVSWPTIGDDEWSVPALMKRKYDKRPLTHCKQSREKSRLVLVLDTSGSCREYAKLFSVIAQAALSFGDVEIYEAPNGYITHKLIPDEGWYGVSAERGIDWRLQGRHIVFFGDWDGAERIIHNSRKSKLYWFDCEARLTDSQMSGWTGPEYGYGYVQFRGKRYQCYNAEDFIRLTKKIK